MSSIKPVVQQFLTQTLRNVSPHKLGDLTASPLMASGVWVTPLYKTSKIFLCLVLDCCQLTFIDICY